MLVLTGTSLIFDPVDSGSFNLCDLRSSSTETAKKTMIQYFMYSYSFPHNIELSKKNDIHYLNCLDKPKSELLSTDSQLASHYQQSLKHNSRSSSQPLTQKRHDAYSFSHQKGKNDLLYFLSHNSYFTFIQIGTLYPCSKKKQI